MFNKKLLTVALALFLSVTFSACDDKIYNTNDNEIKIEVYQVSDYPVWIKAPSNWKNQNKDNLDLQLMAPGGDIYLSVLVYYSIDIAKDQTGVSLYEIQNESILSKRANVSELEPISSKEDEEKVIYSSLYSAEIDGVKNYDPRK